jgi:hypothetical protein
MKNLLILTNMLLAFGFVNSQINWTNETKFEGTIGNYGIVITLAIPYGGAT